MTKGGFCMVVAEECMFAYAIYVIPFYIYFGWWNYLKADEVVHHIPELVKVAIFFVLLFICQACFLRTSLTNPGWILELDIKKMEGTSLEYVEKKHNGKARVCAKCKAPKPDRAHHCSICNRCVLKMDHHCPFVNNCIGFFNYKYFYNFLFWLIVFSIYVIVLVVLDGVETRKIRIIPLIAGIICAIAVFMVSLLFFNHLRFIFSNLSTIEHVEKRKNKRNPYDLGFQRNFTQVFGSNPLLWCFPCWTSVGDGHYYEVLPDTSETSCLLSSSV